MSSQSHQNWFGIARTDGDRRIAEFHAFELERDKLAQLERQAEQQRQQNELIREQNELIARGIAATDKAADDVEHITADDPSDGERDRQAEAWEAEARYRNDADYRVAYHGVLASHELDGPAFDARALLRYGWDIRITFYGIKQYRTDAKYRSAYAWVMRKHRLPANMIVANFIKHRDAIDARRYSLAGRLWG